MALAGLIGTPAFAGQADSTLAPVQALIGAAPCDNDSQCRTIAWGSRPCGGAQAYLAWSTLDLDQATLADAIKAAPAARGRARGGISTCTVLVDPGARCLVMGRAPAASDAAASRPAGVAATGTCVLNSPVLLPDR